MVGTREERDVTEVRMPEGTMNWETQFPVSPLSIRREKPIESSFTVISGKKLWAGAFRDGGSAFHTIRFETIVEARLPYFLYTLRGGHLFSSCAPFAFPLDLLPIYGTPGELTVLSTGTVVATLRLAWSGKAGIRQVMKRDSEFAGVLVSRMEEPGMGINPDAFQMPP
ncbi:MAG: hypothetical protein R6V62_00830 [Candidatus Fermentibacteraceae bacterium]